MYKPNLFSYATSELSQDAFICWLLSWASPEYKDEYSALHECAKEFIWSLFLKHPRFIDCPELIPECISTIRISKQYKNIDVFCVINDTYPIIIEDKISAKNHSGQLERYLKEIKAGCYEQDNIIPIYLKTHDQACYDDVNSVGYNCFLREDFLRVLNAYDCDSDIFSDYRKNLQSIEEAVQSYKNLKLEDWGGHSWVGFYLKLQEFIKGGLWGRVNNSSGGFWGFWWKNEQGKDRHPYLQLENNKLCFKIVVNENIDRKSLRWDWHKKFMEINNKGECGFRLNKPVRFGYGQFMTVCVFEGDYRVHNQGILDLDATVNRLRIAERLFDSVLGEEEI